MLVPLLFLFPLILFTVSPCRYLQEGELSKKHYRSGVIQIFSYFVPNQIEANFYGNKTHEDFQLRNAEVFAGGAAM